MPSSVKMASKSAMRSYISWKHLHSNGYPGWRVKSKWAWIGRIQGTGNETAGGRGLGEVNGVCGAGSSHPGASQITLGEQLPTGGLWSPKGWDSCFREGLTLLFSSVLIHVPHDTALAIRSEGWDVGCTVDSGSSHLALGLVTFGRKLCLQMAVPILLWLHITNTLCRHWKNSFYKYTTQPNSPSLFFTSMPPPIPFIMKKLEGFSN